MKLGYCLIVIIICSWIEGCWLLKSALPPIPTSKSNAKVTVGNLQLSPIGAGTWAWGNQLLWGYSPAIDDELRATYSYLLQQNVNWFDTADSYGTGKLNARSESLLGQFHNLENKKKVYYCTKLAPFPWIIGKDSMKRRILASQERLQRPQIDMIQLHWPPSLRWQEKAYIEAFSEVVKEGKATQVGLSNYGPKQLQRITQQFNQKDIGIYSNQVQFSLLSRLPLQSGLTDVCAELKIQPIAYSPLALGLLTDKYSLDNLPSGPRRILFREYLPVMTSLLDELRDVAKSRRKTVPQVALNWIMQKGFIPLVGMRSMKQAQDNLAAIGWSLSSSEVDCIDVAALKVRKSLLQNINQSD